MFTDVAVQYRTRRSVDRPPAGRDLPMQRPEAVVADKASTGTGKAASLGIRGIEAWLPERGTDNDRPPTHTPPKTGTPDTSHDQVLSDLVQIG